MPVFREGSERRQLFRTAVLGAADWGPRRSDEKEGLSQLWTSCPRNSRPHGTFWQNSEGSTMSGSVGENKLKFHSDQ